MSKLPDFVTITTLLQDLEAIENGEAAATPEWVKQALMSAWADGNLAGDSNAYHGGLYKKFNPFMTEAETTAWYGR